MFKYLTRRTRRAAFTAGIGASIAAGMISAAHSQTTPASPSATVPAAPATIGAVDESAKAILAQIAAAYQGVSSFSAMVNTTNQQGTDLGLAASADIAFAKPNKISSKSTINGQQLSVVSDGVHNFTLDSSSASTYQKADAATDASNIANGIGSSHASMTGLLPLLVSQSNAISLITRGATTIIKQPDENIDGVAVDVVKVVTPRGTSTMTATFAAGKDDHLLRRVVLSIGKNKITEMYTNVKANPELTDATFAFKPALGMKEVIPPPPPPAFDPRLKVGVAPLPFAGTDMSGAKQTLDAYKGKVVLLDFWATWCGPCRGEMPNVIANYDKYHAQGFDIVGVTLDQPNTRDKVTAFTKENKMPWPQIYDGKFWDAALAKAYGVQSIPFSLLIGKDGKIVAVNPRGEALEPALKAALAQ